MKSLNCESARVQRAKQRKGKAKQKNGDERAIGNNEIAKQRNCETAKGQSVVTLGIQIYTPP